MFATRQETKFTDPVANEGGRGGKKKEIAQQDLLESKTLTFNTTNYDFRHKLEEEITIIIIMKKKYSRSYEVNKLSLQSKLLYVLNLKQ